MTTVIHLKFYKQAIYNVCSSCIDSSIFVYKLIYCPLQQQMMSLWVVTKLE